MAYLLLAFGLSTGLASLACADLVVSTINFLAAGPEDAAGLLRFDESTGIALSDGDIPPFASPGGPFGATDIAIGPNGAVFVADGFTGSILQFDGTSGNPLASPVGGPAGLFTGVAPTGGLTFTSIAFDAAGRLYAADASLGAIRVYDGPQGAMPGVQVDTLLDSPSVAVANIASLAFDQNGKLLVSDRDGGKIYRVDVDTDIDEVIVEVLGGSFTPVGMVVDDGGSIFVANLFGSSIQKYDTNGGNGQLFANVPLVAGDTDGGSFPSDVIFDRDGNLLVAVLGGNNIVGSGEGRILRFAPSGTLLETLASGLAPVSSIALLDDLLPGDFNGDGVVDTDDYTVWKSQFGDTVTPTRGADANGDGVVDAADYTVWRDTLGATGIASASLAAAISVDAAQVPEPASIGLLLAGLFAWRFRKPWKNT